MSTESVYRVSSRVSSAILQYAEKNGLPAEELCCELPVPAERLRDNRAWVDAGTVRNLWERLIEAADDPQAPFKVGVFALQQGTLGVLTTILRLTGNPKKVLQRADRVVGYFDNFHLLRAHHVGATSALVEMKLKDKGEQTPFDCAFTRGLLAGIPTLWGLPPAQVEDMSCAVPIGKMLTGDGRVFLADELGLVFSHPRGEPTELHEEGRLAEDGTFAFNEVVYGAPACLYRLTWQKEAARSWWQRTFPNSAALTETVSDLERDLREMEDMYEQLHRVSSRLEQIVAQRTEELEGANVELADLNKKLERQSRLKSEFIADVSHELRTLITAIVGFSNLLTSEIYGELNKRQHSACERISSNTKTLLLMINDLLDLSRMQAGKMVAVFESVNLREVVDGALATVSALAEKKKLSLSLEIEQEVPVSIVSDKTKIKQILLNLLSNAVKFTDRGHVLVRIRRPEPDSVALTVEDTGRGIAEEDLPTLFEQYSRLVHTEAEQEDQSGSGLGLHITKKIVELLQGKIEVVSSVDHGSAFTAMLPVRPSSEAKLPAVEKLASLDPTRSRLTVLIADSDLEQLQFLALSLEAEGLRVEACTDGRNLLPEIRRLEPDLLLIEPLLNHQDGWTTLQALREDEKMATLPVIVVSQAPQTDLAQSLGVRTCFGKPYKKSEVVAAALSALGIIGGKGELRDSV